MQTKRSNQEHCIVNAIGSDVIYVSCKEKTVAIYSFSTSSESASEDA
jgi:hypothetical protein